jgi:hypothetical protein
LGRAKARPFHLLADATIQDEFLNILWQETDSAASEFNVWKDAACHPIIDRTLTDLGTASGFGLRQQRLACKGIILSCHAYSGTSKKWIQGEPRQVAFVCQIVN